MIVQKRGKNTAVAGTVLQAAFTGVMLVIWLATHSLSALSSMLMLVGGVAVWFLSAMLFYCRQLERREAVELEEIRSQAGETGIFRGGAGGEPRPAAARVAFTERWIVPIFTLLWAGYHAAIGVLLLRRLAGGTAPALAYPAEGALGSILIGFLAFLFSRYAVGMSARQEWRLLRATGSYLFVNVLLIVGVTISLVAAWQGYGGADGVIAYAAPIAMLLFAVEITVNLVLDIYRPRVPGQEHRPAFDSRLFNLIAQPERVGHSLAEALNYQFGFEVSKTWFYQLVSRAFVPLMVFAAVVLFAMSCLVIVHEGEQVVVLHWGRLHFDRAPLTAGLHVKWPWPIDTTRRFRTGTVHNLLVGAERALPTRTISPESATLAPLLWSESHLGEQDFLVGLPPTGTKEKTDGIGIVRVSALVRYRIEDVYRYGFEFVDPERQLADIANRELTNFLARVTLIEDLPEGEPMDADEPRSIMTVGRKHIAGALRKAIQQRVSELKDGGLGIRIVDVAVLSVHPPPEAAEIFEQVIQAKLEIETQRYEAEAEANKTLGLVAGDPMRARDLSLSIRALGELTELKRQHIDEKSPAEFRKILAGYLHDARENVKSLVEEVERERRLGRVKQTGQDQSPAAAEARTAAEMNPRQYLLLRHRRYLRLLEDIRDADREGRSFDYERAVTTRRRETEELFQVAYGDPAKRVAEARAEERRRELAERSRADTFQREYEAYLKSPQMYMLDRVMDLMDELLPDIQKYVLAVNRDKVEVRFDFKEQAEIMPRFEERSAPEAPSSP
jgi:regulator of protease activity HflC (stomatin/prohibitin superfamily)